MFSPHTCLFPEDMRLGLDIQRRSEENLHLCTVLLLLRSVEEKKGTSQNSQQVGPVWLSRGQAKAQCAELKSPVCAAWGVGAVQVELLCQKPPWKLRDTQSEIKDSQKGLRAFNSNMRLPRT